MVLNIQEASLREVPQSSPLTQIHLPPVRPTTDVLVSQGAKSVSSSVLEKVKGLFSSIHAWLKRICCCCCKQSKTTSLQILKEAASSFPKMINRMQEGIIGRAEVQKWWAEKYDALEASVQELLLLENVKLYSPEGSDEATANMQKYRKPSIDFVRNLYVQKEDDGNHDPIKGSVQKFIQNVIDTLEKG